MRSRCRFISSLHTWYLYDGCDFTFNAWAGIDHLWVFFLNCKLKRNRFCLILFCLASEGFCLLKITATLDVFPLAASDALEAIQDLRLQDSWLQATFRSMFLRVQQLQYTDWGLLSLWFDASCYARMSNRVFRSQTKCRLRQHPNWNHQLWTDKNACVSHVRLPWEFRIGVSFTKHKYTAFLKRIKRFICHLGRYVWAQHNAWWDCFRNVALIRFERGSN